MKFFLFIILITKSSLWAQDTIFRCPIPKAKIQNIEVDALGAVYAWNENTLWCFTADGETHWTYTNPLNSEISSIDISNPLKIAIYYPDQNTIEILDKKGKLLEYINLSVFNLSDIRAIALASDNSLWIYDAAQRSILNFSFSGVQISKTTDLSFLTNQALKINTIQQANNYLSICLNNKEILFFDTKSVFIKKISLNENEKMIQIINNNDICYELNKILYKKRLFPLQEAQAIGTIPTDTQAIYIADNLYFTNKNSIIGISILSNQKR